MVGVTFFDLLSKTELFEKIIQLLGRSDLLNLMLIKYVNGEFNNKLTHLIETLPREIIDTILHTRVVSYYNGSVVVRSHIEDRLKQIQQSKACPLWQVQITWCRL